MPPPVPSSIRRAAALAAFGLTLGACGLAGVPRLPEAPDAAGAVGSAALDTLEVGIPPGERGTECFQRHLEEAISLNERRRPRYAAWSGGASIPVSDHLIRSERRALVVAWYIDRRARRYQEAGIPIGCIEFVSMALTPPLPAAPRSPGSEAAPSARGLAAPTSVSGPDPDAARDRLVVAYAAGGFPAVASAADSLLDDLADEPNRHCMMRHLIESAWRVAWFAPGHRVAARRAGLPSPIPLSELLLRLHLAVLSEGHALDRMAAPLQEAGIPMLCRDVPPLRHAP